MKPAATFILISLCGSLSAAELPLIALTPVQIERAGVTTVRPEIVGNNPQNPQAGTQLKLGGTVVVPNSGMNLVSTPLAGVVQALRVESLAEVKAGQSVADIYSTEFVTLQQGYLEAAANAAVANSRAARDAALLKDGIIASSRMEETTAAKLRADALLEEHRQGLRLAGLGNDQIGKLKAASDITPVMAVASRTSGAVVEQLATPGQRLEAGSPLFRIADNSRLLVDLHATPAESALIKAGDRVTVPGCNTDGRIVSVGGQLGSASQSVALRAEFDSAGNCLRPNQYVVLTVSAGALGAGTAGLPTSALVRAAGKDYVFVRDASGFRPVAVEVVARGGDRVWVTGSVDANSQVVDHGIATLRGAWVGLGPEAPAPVATGTP